MRYKLVCLLLLSLHCGIFAAQEEPYVEDTSERHALHVRDPRSHIKVFLPSMPYNYVSRLVNEGLVRLAENDQGWEYALATKSTKLSPLLYEFELRRGVRFQDGTPFNADSVMHNFRYFLKQPFNYTNIHRSLKSVEKISDYTIRLHLSQPYGMLYRDLARIYIYSEAYLKTFGWKGAETGANIKASGPYGLGPYILTEGMITGRKQTPKAILKANPYYWEKQYPCIETITFYTELSTAEALRLALYEDGGLDFMQIPFNKKIETMLSPYAKLVSMPSTHNFTIYFNLAKTASPVARKEVRQALNCALNQQSLLDFTYKKEGRLNPAAFKDGACPLDAAMIERTLKGLELNVATQDSLLFLWKGIEYQLSTYGVKLRYRITTSEKEIYDLAQKNHRDTQEWDILIQNTQDWYGRHPWPVFIRYQENNPWSFVRHDALMKSSIETFFGLEQDDALFYTLTQKIQDRAREEAYMLFVPIPNAVFAMNKELVFEPLGIGMQPFWKAKITDRHWSVRGDKAYPEELQKPLIPKRFP
ncbi:ABC transporter substrate-binding protein [Sulfurospirillum sp. hDNRA2]|uniref:ABC transporter substrate-binding protein n=1 Tax=Sulfurospirillum sp. hDNRA2 TaxID=3237298 RepID=UPI0020B689FF|nr:ABC transporter substrate-binding protein [Sulfurospirillum sp. DNRA8]MCP3652130.1 ABC transporter substrate-binding protein [Sulfurospirillum sp. DNRA8]MCR1810980.1 ABC transporter substrate-binding protein [Sulfurospirillum sp. DNRA8]